VGTFQALGDDHNPNGRAVVQMAGQLLRVDAAGFRHELQRNPLLGEAIQSHLRALVIQVTQSVACAAAHTTRERLARWMLQTSDRVASNDIRLTHEFLAQILHVRRASVTLALRELQHHGAVATRRGGTTISDREALETLACECYGLVRSEYARLIPGEPPAP
jgi:CRP-like cAMP-binding protein